MKMLGIFLFGFATTMLSFSQVHLFEQGNTGLIVPSIGIFANPDIQEVRAGAEYNVEGKFAIGGYYSQPLSDTLFGDQYDVQSTIIHPYIYLELFEPDKVFPISLSLKANYRHVFGEKETNPSKKLKARFKRYVFSGGPIVGARFFMGSRSLIIPHAGYEFGYVTDDRREPGQPKEISHPLWHDINLGVIYSAMFNNILGVVVEPKATIRFGGDKTVEYFIPFHAGLIIRII